MSVQSIAALQAFQWTPQPAPAELVERLLQDYLDRTPCAMDLARRMREHTGTRLLDWVNHLVVRDTADIQQQLQTAGFIAEPTFAGHHCFVHGGGLFPRQRAIDDCGADVGCDLFFAAEREYWQRRNHAAQVQKARQDRLGLGWANRQGCHSEHGPIRDEKGNRAALGRPVASYGLVWTKITSRRQWAWARRRAPRCGPPRCP